MVISYDNQKLRSICENELVAISEFGFDCTNLLKSKLAELDAVESLKEYFDIFKDATKNSDTISIPVTNGLNIVLTIKHVTIPMNNDEIDWSKVRRIKIIEIK